MADHPSQRSLADFVSEAQEIIDALGKDLLRLEGERGGEDPALVNAVFRHAHSLKGLAGMFGVEGMGGLSHALEDLLDGIRMGRRLLDAATLDLMLETPEVFSRIVAEEVAGAPPASAGAAERLAERLRAAGAVAGPAAAPSDPLAGIDIESSVRRVLTEYEEHRLRTNVASGVALYRIGASFDLATFDVALADLNGRLRLLGEVIATLPSSDSGEPTAIGFDLLFGSREPLDAVRAAGGPGTTVEEIRRRPTLDVRALASGAEEGGAAARGAPEAGSPPDAGAGGPAASIRSASQAVRVDIGKLDRLMNVVGELVILKTSLARLAERINAGEHGPRLTAELYRQNRRLDRKLSELEAGTLELRMVPLGLLFEKLSRVVRKLARELGKEIEFRVRGGEVELDKLIAEELSDPLMHLLRNAIDHAIEQPEVRIRAGKPPAGRVSLSAEQKGHHVVIAVEDDGTGIDEERVREVAVQRGLASPKAARELSHREALNLIFVPGFSTARQVTTVSGRGVGMDVVKHNVANLSGAIDLRTERGKGTRFEITLPVTLAMIRALVVGIAGRPFAIPLDGVLEILSVDPSEVRVVETREVVAVRGATLPLVRLGAFLGFSGEVPPRRTGSRAAKLLVVVVGLSQERLGLVVEDVEGRQDIVVKPLGPALAGVRGISGAADLGTGRTVLVLDVGAVIEEVVNGPVAREAAG